MTTKQQIKYGWLLSPIRSVRYLNVPTYKKNKYCQNPVYAIPPKETNWFSNKLFFQGKDHGETLLLIYLKGRIFLQNLFLKFSPLFETSAKCFKSDQSKTVIYTFYQHFKQIQGIFSKIRYVCGLYRISHHYGLWSTGEMFQKSNNVKIRDKVLNRIFFFRKIEHFWGNNT